MISEVGEGVTGWSVGDEVCALLSGGGYAERVAVPAGQLLPRPAGRGAGHRGGAARGHLHRLVQRLPAGRAAARARCFLVHGGSSGIGTMAIQLAARAGARVFTTAGTAAKLDVCRELGAEVGINYRDEDFVERVKEETDGAGVDVILDNMGAKYLARNVDALAVGGRLVVIGMQGGTKAELDLGKLMAKRASVHATTLRARPATGHGGKAEIVAAVRHDVWPDVERGRHPPDRRPPAADVPRRRGAPADRGQRAHRQGAAAAGGLSRAHGPPSPPSPTRTTAARSRSTSAQPRQVPSPAAEAGHSPAGCRTPSRSTATSWQVSRGRVPATQALHVAAALAGAPSPGPRPRVTVTGSRSSRHTGADAEDAEHRSRTAAIGDRSAASAAADSGDLRCGPDTGAGVTPPASPRSSGAGSARGRQAPRRTRRGEVVDRGGDAGEQLERRRAALEPVAARRSGDGASLSGRSAVEQLRARRRTAPTCGPDHLYALVAPEVGAERGDGRRRRAAVACDAVDVDQRAGRVRARRRSRRRPGSVPMALLAAVTATSRVAARRAGRRTARPAARRSSMSDLGPPDRDAGARRRPAPRAARWRRGPAG